MYNIRKASVAPIGATPLMVTSPVALFVMIQFPPVVPAVKAVPTVPSVAPYPSLLDMLSVLLELPVVKLLITTVCAILKPPTARSKNRKPVVFAPATVKPLDAKFVTLLASVAASARISNTPPLACIEVVVEFSPSARPSLTRTKPVSTRTEERNVLPVFCNQSVVPTVWFCFIKRSLERSKPLTGPEITVLPFP